MVDSVLERKIRDVIEDTYNCKCLFKIQAKVVDGTYISPALSFKVDEIKENAPSTFRLGNRLVTTSDYRTYVLNNFSNRVSDVYVCPFISNIYVSSSLYPTKFLH